MIYRITFLQSSWKKYGCALIVASALSAPLVVAISPELERAVRIYELIDYMWTPMTVALKAGWGMSLYKLAKRFIQEKFGCSPEELLKTDDLDTLNDEQFKELLITHINSALTTITQELKNPQFLDELAQASSDSSPRQLIKYSAPQALELIEYLDSNLEHSTLYTQLKIQPVSLRMLEPLQDTIAVPKDLQELRCSDDGNILVARSNPISSEVYIYIRDVHNTWQYIQTIISPCYSMALSNDGSCLLLGGLKGTISIWKRDLFSGKMILMDTLMPQDILIPPNLEKSLAHIGSAYALCCFPHNENRFFSGHQEGSLLEWTRTATTPWQPRIVALHQYGISGISVHPTGTSLVALTENNDLLIFETGATEQIKLKKVVSLAGWHNIHICAHPFANQWLVCQGMTLTPITYNANLKQWETQFNIQLTRNSAAGTSITSACWTPYYVAFGMDNGTIRLLKQLPSRLYHEEPNFLTTTKSKSLISLCASRTSGTVFSCAADFDLQEWNITPARTLGQALFLKLIAYANPTALNPHPLLLQIWNSLSAGRQKQLKSQFADTLAHFMLKKPTK